MKTWLELFGPIVLSDLSNGKDDDANGYVDDMHGWNFLGDAVHENLEYVRILKKER